MRQLKNWLLGVSLSVAALAAEARETWDMPLAYPATNYHSQLAASFAEQVNAGTEAIHIVTHPGGIMLKGSEIFGAVRRGLVPIGERLMSALGVEDPLLELDSVPFVARNFDQAYQLYLASRPAIDELLAKRQLKLLYAVPWPEQGLYSKQQINSLDDMLGFKLRIYNAQTERLATQMGAIPTRMELAKLDKALKKEQLLGLFGSTATGFDRQLWKSLDYWYDLKAWLPKNMVVVNLKAWQQLDPATQQLMLAAANSTEQQGWRKAQEFSAWYTQQLSGAGMQLLTPGEELEQQLQQLEQQQLQHWLDRVGDRGREIITRYRKLVQGEAP